MNFTKKWNFNDFITKKIIYYIETMLIIVVQLLHDVHIFQVISKRVQSEVIQVLGFQSGPVRPSLGGFLVLNLPGGHHINAKFGEDMRSAQCTLCQNSGLKQSFCLGLQTTHGYKYVSSFQACQDTILHNFDL